MAQYETSIEELQKRAAAGDKLAQIALRYREGGAAALIKDLKGDKPKYN